MLYLFEIHKKSDTLYFYTRVHATEFSFGRIFNGIYQFGAGVSGAGSAISSGNWYSLRIVVQGNKNVELYLNDKKIGNFNAKFTTRGYGGVIVATGYKNVVQFRNFKLAPVVTQL